MRPDVQVAPIKQLLDRLAADVSVEAAHARARRSLFAMALPGGSVGVHGFPVLATVLFDWDVTHLFWADERAVPASSPDSNFGLADSLWLRKSGASSSSIHPMLADRTDLNGAAAAYSEELVRVLGKTPRLDVVLLGVGPDGHVASLFPGHAALSAEHQLTLPIVDAPKPPPRRLTLSMPLLTSAERVIVMALGDAKAAVMQEALEQKDSPLPVSHVLRRASRPLVLLDEAAGSFV